MPTTVTSTIRSSGGDYSLLSTWEAAKQGNLVTADQVQVAECYDDWASGLNDNVTVAGWTTDSTRYPKITVAAGHRHDGTPQSGFYMKKTQTWGSVVVLQQAQTRVEWLDVWNSATSGDSSGFTLMAVAFLSNCLGRTQSTEGLSAGFTLTSGGGASHLYQCLGYGSGTGFMIDPWSGSTYYNCVAANNSNYGFNKTADGLDSIAKNCVAYSGATPWSTGSGWSSSCANNASSEASGAPGSSAVHSITSAAFADATGGNFHLASGSVLIGAGTNLYSTFTTDIDGDTWPSSGAWDIGFDYRVASGGAQTLTPSLFSNTNTFYSPTVSQGAVTLTPSLFTNSQTFYSATVSLGSVTLTPTLFSNDQTFYSPTVSTGSVTLTPSLFTNSQTFYAPTVTPGSVTLTPLLFSNNQTFYSAIVTGGGTQLLQPTLVSNSQTFYGPTVTVGAVTLTPAFVTNYNTFYSATVSQSAQVIEPPLVESVNQFFTTIVTTGGVTITPGLFTNNNSFYTASITNGTLTLSQADIDAIVNTLLADPRMLTLPKWLGLR